MVTKSGDVIEFSPKSPANYDFSKNSIVGLTKTGKAVELPADDIVGVKVRQIDPGKTIASAVLATAIIGGLIIGAVIFYYQNICSDCD